MDGADGGLAAPACTGDFASSIAAMLGDGVGEFLGQIKIAPNAFVVGTIKAEYRLGVINVHIFPSGGNCLLSYPFSLGSVCLAAPHIELRRVAAYSARRVS